MRIFKLAALAAFWWVSSAQAQTTIGDAVTLTSPVGASAQQVEAVGGPNGGFVVLLSAQPKDKAASQFLYGYDSTLTERWKVVVPKLDKGMTFNSAVARNGKLYVFYNWSYRKLNEESLLVQQYDAQTGALVGAMDTLVKMKKPLNNEITFHVKRLAQGRIFCYGRRTAYDRMVENKGLIRFDYVVLNTLSGQRQAGMIRFPFKPDDFQDWGFDLSEDGQKLYLLAKLDMGMQRYIEVDRKLHNDLNLLLYRQDVATQAVDTTRINTKLDRRSDGFARILSGGRMVLGVYSGLDRDEERSDNIQFYYGVFPADSLSEYVYPEFQELQIRSRDEEASKGSRWKLGPFYLQPDGSVYITGQKYRPAAGSSVSGVTGGFATFRQGPTGMMGAPMIVNTPYGPLTSPGLPTYNYWNTFYGGASGVEYKYFDAFQIYLNRDSSQSHLARIPIRQVQGLEKEREYFSIETETHVAFIYRELQASDSKFYLVKVKKNGQVEPRQELLGGQVDRKDFRPQLTQKLGPNKVLLVFYDPKNKGYVLYPMTLN